jgi:hypothetical protein
MNNDGYDALFPQAQCGHSHCLMPRLHVTVLKHSDYNKWTVLAYPVYSHESDTENIVMW